MSSATNSPSSPSLHGHQMRGESSNSIPSPGPLPPPFLTHLSSQFANHQLLHHQWLYHQQMRLQESYLNHQFRPPYSLNVSSTAHPMASPTKSKSETKQSTNHQDASKSPQNKTHEFKSKENPSNLMYNTATLPTSNPSTHENSKSTFPNPIVLVNPQQDSADKDENVKSKTPLQSQTLQDTEQKTQTQKSKLTPKRKSPHSSKQDAGNLSPAMVPSAVISISNSGGKDVNVVLARKIHKADREKLRRDRLNDQFQELSGILDPDRPKHDKASIVSDGLSLLKELQSEVKRLKHEQALLLEESKELISEKTELRQEKLTLKSETERYNCQLQEKLRDIIPWLLMDPSFLSSPTFASAYPFLLSFTRPPLSSSSPSPSSSSPAPSATPNYSLPLFPSFIPMSSSSNPSCDPASYSNTTNSLLSSPPSSHLNVGTSPSPSSLHSHPYFNAQPSSFPPVVPNPRPFSLPVSPDQSPHPHSIPQPQSLPKPPNSFVPSATSNHFPYYYSFMSHPFPPNQIPPSANSSNPDEPLQKPNTSNQEDSNALAEQIKDGEKGKELRFDDLNDNSSLLKKDESVSSDIAHEMKLDSSLSNAVENASKEKNELTKNKRKVSVGEEKQSTNVKENLMDTSMWHYNGNGKREENNVMDTEGDVDHGYDRDIRKSGLVNHLMNDRNQYLKFDEISGDGQSKYKNDIETKEKDVVNEEESKSSDQTRDLISDVEKLNPRSQNPHFVVQSDPNAKELKEIAIFQSDRDDRGVNGIETNKKEIERNSSKCNERISVEKSGTLTSIPPVFQPNLIHSNKSFESSCANGATCSTIINVSHSSNANHIRDGYNTSEMSQSVNHFKPNGPKSPMFSVYIESCTSDAKSSLATSECSTSMSSLATDRICDMNSTVSASICSKSKGSSSLFDTPISISSKKPEHLFFTSETTSSTPVSSTVSKTTFSSLSSSNLSSVPFPSLNPKDTSVSTMSFSFPGTSSISHNFITELSSNSSFCNSSRPLVPCSVSETSLTLFSSIPSSLSAPTTSPASLNSASSFCSARSQSTFSLSHSSLHSNSASASISAFCNLSSSPSTPISSNHIPSALPFYSSSPSYLSQNASSISTLSSSIPSGIIPSMTSNSLNLFGSPATTSTLFPTSSSPLLPTFLSTPVANPSFLKVPHGFYSLMTSSNTPLSTSLTHSDNPEHGSQPSNAPHPSLVNFPFPQQFVNQSHTPTASNIPKPLFPSPFQEYNFPSFPNYAQAMFNPSNMYPYSYPPLSPFVHSSSHPVGFLIHPMKDSINHANQILSSSASVHTLTSASMPATPGSSSLVTSTPTASLTKVSSATNTPVPVELSLSTTTIPVASSTTPINSQL